MSDGQVVGFDEIARYTSDELATILEVEHWRARIGDLCVPETEIARRAPRSARWMWVPCL
jgi:hypothetical protein